MFAKSQISLCCLYYRICSKEDEKLDLPGGQEQVTNRIKQMFPEQRELTQHLALGEGWWARMPSDITGQGNLWENSKQSSLARQEFYWQLCAGINQPR